MARKKSKEQWCIARERWAQGLTRVERSDVLEGNFFTSAGDAQRAAETLAKGKICKRVFFQPVIRQDGQWLASGQSF